MAIEYRHTQPGYVTAGATGAGLLFAAKMLLRAGPAAAIALPVAAVLGGAAVLFSSLTIVIEDGVLRSYFGPGLPAKTAKIEEIASAEVVENPWYAGWGIRVLPRGMLYNVSGLKAVEITLKNGQVFRLGTDEPDALRAAIRAAVERRREAPQS
jgi:hypothetical protein